MIVTVTGTFQNVGDYLIVTRAQNLLKHHLDEQIININRREIDEKAYQVFNDASLIFLCGGPAYQQNMFPGVYDLELGRIQTKIIPFGLGLKCPIEKVHSLAFSKQSEQNIKALHQNIKSSSCRDIVTQKKIMSLGVENITMTGCPAWYHLDYLQQPYEHKNNTESIAVSAPAKIDASFIRFLQYIAERFPSQRKLLGYHHGFHVRGSMRTRVKGLQFYLSSLYGRALGYEIHDLSGGYDGIEIYNDIDLHIGYRVHAHLYCLSRRQASLLINEDIRGFGQNQVLQQQQIHNHDTDLINKVDSWINQHQQSQGKDIQKAVAIMQNTYRVVMAPYLDELKTLL